jgi:hypothetical protein
VTSSKILDDIIYCILVSVFTHVLVCDVQVFRAIQKSSQDLLSVLERYQDKLCGKYL